MNFKDKLLILKKSIKVKKMIIFGIVITIILTLLFLIVTFNHTIFNYIYNVCHNSYLNRTLIVDDLDENDKEKFAKNEHILSINYQNATTFSISNDEYEEIVLYPIDENTMPDIISGSNVLEKGSLICPLNFVPKFNAGIDFSLTTEYALNGNDLIGKTIDYNIEKKMYNGITAEIVDSTTKTFTITGIYNSQKYMMDNNICFISYEDFNEIYNFLYDEEPHSAYIVVDDFKNIESVTKFIESNDYFVEPLTNLDYSTIYTFLVLSLIGLGIFLLLIYLMINFNIKRELTKNEEEIFLYKSMGYSKKDILKIYYFEYITYFGIATIISIVLSLIIVEVFKKYVSNIILFQLIVVKYNYIEFIFLLIFGILYPTIVILIKTNKILNSRRIRL